MTNTLNPEAWKRNFVQAFRDRYAPIVKIRKEMEA